MDAGLVRRSSGGLIGHIRLKPAPVWAGPLMSKENGGSEGREALVAASSTPPG